MDVASMGWLIYSERKTLRRSRQPSRQILRSGTACSSSLESMGRLGRLAVFDRDRCAIERNPRQSSCTPSAFSSCSRVLKEAAVSVSVTGESDAAPEGVRDCFEFEGFAAEDDVAGAVSENVRNESEPDGFFAVLPLEGELSALALAP
jgi:hypothetical protein